MSRSPGIPEERGAATAADTDAAETPADDESAALAARIESLAPLFSGYPGPVLLFDRDATPAGVNAAGRALAGTLDGEGGATAMPHLVQLAVKARIAGKGMTREVPMAGERARLEATMLPQADGTLLMLGRNATLDASIRTALAESRTRFKDLVELAADFAWETDAEGRFTYISPRGALGFPSDRLTGRAAADLVIPDGAPTPLPFSCTEPVRNVEVWLTDASDTPRCLLISAAPMTDARQARIGARGIAMDVTAERVQQNELSQLKTRERLVQYILDALRGEVDPQDMLAAAAEALAQATSARACVLRIVDDGRPVVGAHYGEAPEAGIVDAALADLGDEEAITEGSDGGLAWLRVATRHHGRVIGGITLWRDAADMPWSAEDHALLQAVERHFGIAFRQIADQFQLETLSRTDELTGLSNRRAFFEDVAESLERCVRRGETGALLYIDLDHFKPINDRHGHEAGDRVLAALGARLDAATRGYDRTARLGGDEFAVWMEGAGAEIARRRAADFLADIADLAREFPDLDPPLSASIGLALFDPARPDTSGRTEDMAGLVARADAAMYTAKRREGERLSLAPPDGDGDDGTDTVPRGGVSSVDPSPDAADAPDSDGGHGS